MDHRPVRDPGRRSEHGSCQHGLLLENGDRLWHLLRRLDVDLLLAAGFHADTTRSNDDHTPVQLVHGGPWTRAAWVTVDIRAERLDLTWWESVTTIEGWGTIWNPSPKRALNKVVAGTPEETGTLTIHRDGSLSDAPATAGGHPVGHDGSAGDAAVQATAGVPPASA
jgi:hypothetical protein